ncbi:SGNH/GDSL hydrolase family protein [Paenibacillus solani]|uniref:SGNH/GDSL hydrolase family protein n=1 Tax=Paenibacillus solani TaxID=1705565 RepID=UPI003D27DF8A
MKQRKALMVWGLALLIFALGYLGFHSQAPADSEPEKTSIQSFESSKEISIHTQTEPKNDIHSLKETKHSESASIDGEGVTVIGDSVIVGVEPYLKEKLPKVTVDGKVGRQMSQARKLIEELSAQGKLGDRIIVELGTNGPFSKDQLRSLLTSLAKAKQVLVVTTRVPKGWQDTVNSNIKDVVGDFENAKVVDWYAASEGKEDYFYKDGVHLKPDGSRFYASLLIQGLQEK